MPIKIVRADELKAGFGESGELEIASCAALDESKVLEEVSEEVLEEVLVEVLVEVSVEVSGREA
ncbi:hypothetical protein HMPREF3230_01323 [Gardnerella vaginalis]|uniref:Uncharacterized protein n=1 Tax=Gardnerella vaginalis TaxID=2702 RepID=A0A135Z1T7_GARVA|nr:hypothetical protein HMPREF3230_01323 [Gardnerella vaginalis]